jgi:hemolysin activation/secretion protein
MLRHQHRWVVGGLLLLSPFMALAAQAPPPQATPGAVQPLPQGGPQAAPVQPLLSVPTMPNRPLDPEEGPRVKVTSFKLVDAHDFPKLGLTISALNAQLDAAIKAQPATGYTVLHLQQVAKELSDVYHKHGLILAQVVLPAQEIRDGTVQLRVIEGVLASVQVENNKRNRAAALSAPFDPLVGKAFEQDATDAALLRLTEFPGLSVFGVVTPGSAVGTSDLVLRVQREKPFSAVLGVDNFGSELSGEYRGSANLTWNSPFRSGDRLNVFAVYTTTDNDSAAQTQYGGIDYRLPLFAARGAISLGYSANNYDVGQALDVSGKVRSASAGYHHDFYRTRRSNVFGDLDYSDRKADVTFPIGNPGLEQVKAISGSVGLRYTDTHRGFSEASVSFLRGKVSTPSAGKQNVRGDVDRNYNVVGVRLSRQQAVTRYQSLLFSVNGQFTSDAVATLDQMALGGPASLRGFDVASYVADSGYFGSVEWVIGAPGFAKAAGPMGKTWGDLLQFSLFFDAGRGEVNRGDANLGVVIPKENLRDWGASLQFNLPDRFYARVAWAKKLSPGPITSGVDPDSSHIYGSIGLVF